MYTLRNLYKYEKNICAGLLAFPLEWVKGLCWGCISMGLCQISVMDSKLGLQGLSHSVSLGLFQNASILLWRNEFRLSLACCL